MDDLYDLISEFNDNSISVRMVPSLWKKLDGEVSDLIHDKTWKTFKFYKVDQNRSDEIENISSSSGGIYLFYIDPGIITERHRVRTYIGRAEYTDNQNLRKRIREYYGYMPPDTRRVRIGWMLKNWWEYLYCSYIELSDNELIDKVEKELINALLPPMNTQIPDVTISAASRAAF